MLEQWKRFDSPYPILSWDWLYVSKENHNAIKNIIFNTPSSFGDVMVDFSNYSALILLNEEYYEFSLRWDSDVIINGWAWVVNCTDCGGRWTKEKTREIEQKVIEKTEEEMAPFFEWRDNVAQHIDNQDYDYVAILPSNVKSLLISWINELGGVAMDAAALGAMVLGGRVNKAVEELNVYPEDYYMFMHESASGTYHIEHSEECYPTFIAYDEVNDTELALYYANYPEKNFDTISDDLYSIDANELLDMTVEGDDWTQNIDWRVYSFEPTTDNSADVKVIISGREYRTSFSIETDGETWDNRMVMDEISYNTPVEEEPEPSRDAVRTVATNWWVAYPGDYEHCDIR